MATVTKGRTFVSGEVVTPTKLNTLVDSATVTAIVDADIASDAAIADTKLATISTPGKVSGNAITSGTITANLTGAVTGNATTATTAASCSGNSATATTAASCSGNSATATTLQTARTIAISGDVTGTATSFNGGAGISIPAVITPGIIDNADISASAAIADTKLATIATAGKVSNSATTATSANTASAIVTRDASGNFSAGTITANLTGAVTGNASTATTLQTARTIAISGDVTGTATSFNGSSDISISSAITAGAIVTSDIADAQVTTAKIVDGAITSAKLNSSVILVPAGAVMPFAMNAAPTGWLAADGTAVSRTIYSALWTALGTTSSPYGQGDGSTTFNLPDLRGYFVRGSGTNSDGTASGTFGAKQADELKSHVHGLTANRDVSPGTGLKVNWSDGAPISVPSTGSTGGTETRPANIALLYCIKF